MRVACVLQLLHDTTYALQEQKVELLAERH
jgi:hypothetical protein